jgi:hypothetical protein
MEKAPAACSTDFCTSLVRRPVRGTQAKPGGILHRHDPFRSQASSRESYNVLAFQAESCGPQLLYLCAMSGSTPFKPYVVQATQGRTPRKGNSKLLIHAAIPPLCLAPSSATMRAGCPTALVPMSCKGGQRCSVPVSKRIVKAGSSVMNAPPRSRCQKKHVVHRALSCASEWALTPCVPGCRQRWRGALPDLSVATTDHEMHTLYH